MVKTIKQIKQILRRRWSVGTEATLLVTGI